MKKSVSKVKMILSITAVGFVLMACDKYQPNGNSSDSNMEQMNSNWKQIKRYVVFENQKYEIDYKVLENSNSIEFVNNLPLNVLKTLEPYEKAGVTAQIVEIDKNGKEIIYLFKNEQEMNSDKKFLKDIESLKIEKSSNNGDVGLKNTAHTGIFPRTVWFKSSGGYSVTINGFSGPFIGRVSSNLANQNMNNDAEIITVKNHSTLSSVTAARLYTESNYLGYQITFICGVDNDYAESLSNYPLTYTSSQTWNNKASSIRMGWRAL